MHEEKDIVKHLQRELVVTLVPKPACATSPHAKKFCTKEKATSRRCKDGDHNYKHSLPLGDLRRNML